MVRQMNKDDIADIRKRAGGKAFLYVREGEVVEIEIVDQTFSLIFSGETGLDEREVTWNQPQITVRDMSDDITKTFKDHESTAEKIFKCAEDNGIDPLHMKGAVFRVERPTKYERRVELVRKAGGMNSGSSSEIEMTDKNTVRKMAKKVLEDNNTLKFKEAVFFTKESLKDEGLMAADEDVSEIVAEVMEL